MATDKKTRRVVKGEEGIVVTLPPVKAPGWLQGFVDFIREQGVIGVAVGLVMGVALKSIVDSMVANIFNPLVGVLTGGESLATKSWCMKHIEGTMTCATDAQMRYGQVLSDVLSFLIVAAVVYFLVKGLKLDKFDKKKA